MKINILNIIFRIYILVFVKRTIYPNLILFIFSSLFYPLLCRIRQMMFVRHLLFMERQHRAELESKPSELQDISGCDFRTKLKMLKIFVWWATYSILTIQGPALKACKLIFFCENNKNVLRGILTDLWLIPAFTRQMIGWLGKHNTQL